MVKFAACHKRFKAYFGLISTYPDCTVCLIITDKNSVSFPCSEEKTYLLSTSGNVFSIQGRHMTFYLALFVLDAEVSSPHAEFMSIYTFTLMCLSAR